MSWFSRPPRPPTAAALIEEALRHLAPRPEVLSGHLPRALVASTVTPLLGRVLALCWDLPASDAHHHPGAFGLLAHSLDVAGRALETFRRSSLWWARAPDPAARHRSQDRWRLGTALAGLLHDLGKVFDVSLSLEDNEGLPATWEPLAEPLLYFLLRHRTGDTLPRPTLTWQPGRGKRHEAAGALAAALVLTRDDLRRLGPAVARELFAYLGGAPEPANLFYQLIARPLEPSLYAAADGESVRADREAHPASSPGLAGRVLEALAVCCREGPLRVNQFPGHVFVLPAETLVVVPEAFKFIRARLARDGVRLPPGAVLYNDLAAAGYLLGPPGQNVTRALFDLDGRRVPLAVLRLPHALLWGPQPPALFTGQVHLEAPAPTPLAAAPAPEEGVPHGRS